MNQNDVNTLINFVSTDEWLPLPLHEVSAITGKSPSRCGIVFRTLLGLPTQGGGSRHPKCGSTYIENAYGYRFARCYHNSTGESTRYWWRRFPVETSDAAILSSAKSLTARAKLIGPLHLLAQPSLLSAPSASRLPEFKPATGLAAEITKAAAEAEKAAQHLERLINLRDSRISQLEAELSSLRAL
jgi:hypothetical protein